MNPTDTPTVVFAGGGSGGHLYPALAVAHELGAKVSGLRTVFMGTDRFIEHRILDHAECEFVAQELPGLSPIPWRWPGLVLAYQRAAVRVRAYLNATRPSLVVGTGGLASVPAIRQARSLGIPTAILNPDAIPGRANRHLGPLVDLVCVQWEETRDHFPKARRLEVTGCPVREGFNHPNRESGIARFGLDPARKTLLVTGASQGARTVNEAVLGIAGMILGVEGWQLLHLTGAGDFETVRRAYAERSIAPFVLEYTDYMADALAAADLVIARAGASTLAELTAVGVASVLMPYPHHRDNHQTANARCLVRAGAARLVADEIDAELNARKLWEAVEPLLRDDATRQSMAWAAQSMGRGNAASSVAETLIELMSGCEGARPRETMEAALT